MPQMEIKEVIYGFGHKNIRATHPTTFEITKEKHVTLNGDCIVVSSADKGLLDLNKEFLDALCRNDAKLKIIFEVENEAEYVEALGSEELKLGHPAEMVVRKSKFISDRTLAVLANKAAKDFSRSIVQNLKDPEKKVKITLIVYI